MKKRALYLTLAALGARHPIWHLARPVDSDKAIQVGVRADLPHSYTSIDIETTGLINQDPRIIELGAVRIRNGRPTATYSQLVDPSRPIPTRITTLTGIDDTAVTGKPTIGQLLPGFLQFCGNDTLIGHNIDRFDMPIIQAEAGRNDVATGSRATIDTLPLSQKLCPELGRHRVIDLIQALGIATTERHRAADDALQTAQIYEILRKRT